MREQLAQFMEDTGMNQSQVAKALGRSSSAVSQYLKGVYKGVTKDIDDSVERLIKRHKDKVVERTFKEGFVETYFAQRCLDAVYISHVEGEICVLVASAGLGKTATLKHYKSQNPDVILIEVDPSYTPKVLLKTLCQQLGINDTGINHDLFVRITQKLDNSRLIMIDEAELLSTQSLEYIRRIHDATKCGVVLAGMPRLIVNLKGKYGELEQLYSRAGIAPDFANTLSEEDIGLLSEYALGTDKFNALLFKLSRGNARRLTKLMRGAIRLAEMHGKQVDEKLIHSYANMLIH